MKSKVQILFVLIFSVCFIQIAVKENKNESAPAESHFVPGSCTIFAASFGSTVLYGNNEDYRIPKTYYWAEPSGENIYGGVFLGFETFSLKEA